MRVLIGCEYSGTVRDAFRRRGHDAWSCDMLPSDSPGPHHFQADLLDVIADYQWDALIAFPPCTYLANSGARWLYEQGTRNRVESRWTAMRDGAAFFRRLWTCDAELVALENPIQHRHAREAHGLTPSQTIQPYQFGHEEQKATQLYLRGFPLLKETHNVHAAMLTLPLKARQRVWRLGPSEDRWKQRSTTFAGIAAAMASQWG